MVRNHQNKISQNHSIPVKNNTIECKNNTIEGKNNIIECKNNTLDGKNNTFDENVTNELPYQCESCYKKYKCMKSLKRHSEQCSLLKNPLQCPICYKQFMYQQNKSRHMKTCKVNVLEPLPSSDTPDTQTINNNITINQQIAEKIENNTVNNNNIIVFPIDGHTINFLTDHITKKDMRAALKCGNAHQGLQNFIDILFQREENRCISKTDSKSPYCKIHKGNNHWAFAVDDDVIPKLTTNTSEMALEYIENNTNGIKIPKHTLDFIAGEYNRIVSEENPSFKAAKKRVKASLLSVKKSMTEI